MLRGNQFLAGRHRLLDHGDVRIDMQGMDGRLEGARRNYQPSFRIVVVLRESVHTVQAISRSRGIRGEEIADAVNVLAQIHSARTEMWEELFEGDALLPGQVPAIVDHDVDRGKLGAHALPERAIRLIADEHADA